MVYLASINHHHPFHWNRMSEDLHKQTTLPVHPLELEIDLKLYYSKNRKQYHSTLILSKILNYLPNPNGKIVGITNVDIFTPILTFLFGEAQLGGNGAIVSTHRLRNEFYGLPSNDDLLYYRTLKEILHELGHTMGLIHCQHYECVMHFSTYVEDIDLKKAQFCPLCEKKLKQD